MGRKRHKQERRKRQRVTVDLPQLDSIVEAATERTISQAEATTLKTAIHAMAQQLTPEFRTSEKASEVVEGSEAQGSEAEADSAPVSPKGERKRGHGRNGASAYTGAQRIPVPHPELSSGACCPCCQKGRVYPMAPSPLVRIKGRPAPIEACVYEQARYRCNACGEVYVAPPPEGVGPEKYDETVPSAVALLKYGKGFPFNRLAALQGMVGVPLAAAIQWTLVEDAAELLRPAHEELIRLAAQGDVVHNDDTSMRVVGLKRPEDDKRTGVFTTSVVSVSDGHKIALFMTGTQHAGENLGDVLKLRASELPPPTQMCDALSRNVPRELVHRGVEILLANCLTHGRRQFVDQIENFPEACKRVIEDLGQVYFNDKTAREAKLDAAQRLKYHQEHSGPLMDELHRWMTQQLETKQVEPNSGLGKAMNYFLRRWHALTQFLRIPGAPLDNNICERALKKAILHRKNALFYRTMNGAQVGDLYMSLIHTCELNGVPPFDYLTELQRHAEEVRVNPASWMPWNYHQALARGDPA